MNIIQPYARLVGPLDPKDQFTLQDGIRLLRRIEYFGRISHRSEEAQTEDSWKRIITNIVMEHGDWSIVEHASVTVDAVVDRGITHEWVRHRLFSFTQQSTRFINHEKKMPASFVEPEIEPTQKMDDPISLDEKRHLCKTLWRDAINDAESRYIQLIRLGVAPQIARSIFPNALSSRIATTGNLRNWRHFLIMRTTKEAHPQMRQVTLPLLEEFKEKIPLLFDDIKPLSRQIDNLRLPR